MRLLSKIQFVLMLAISASISYGQNQTGINFFNGSFSEAVKLAKEEKKHIFLDAYASWCGPCKAMERDVFTDPEIVNFFNTNFVSVHIDMEKGEGPALAKRLTSIDGYPSLLFFSPEGHLSKTLLGSRSGKAFLAEARLVAQKE